MYLIRSFRIHNHHSPVSHLQGENDEQQASTTQYRTGSSGQPASRLLHGHERGWQRNSRAGSAGTAVLRQQRNAADRDEPGHQGGPRRRGREVPRLRGRRRAVSVRRTPCGMEEGRNRSLDVVGPRRRDGNQARRHLLQGSVLRPPRELVARVITKD